MVPTSFYERHTVTVARALLGKILVVRGSAGRIVETEAYRSNDPASHSFRGLTPRTRVMFGPPGVAYVYFIYGMYEMLNFVCEKEGRAGAVLIRALEPMREGMQTSGPGKLCRALGIRMSDNGKSLMGPEIRVCDDGYVPKRVGVSPRIGITRGTDKLWRFYEDGNPFVSR